jgi:alpha-beta hydrolase superfamily lysophospholipase
MNTISEWQTQTYRVPIGNTMLLAGFLNVPEHARGTVLFAHGSGSSRHSPRNQYVARVLHHAGFATMLIDLFTEREEEYDRFTGRLRFDINLLSERVAAATDWLTHHPPTASLKIGYFGASTGAAAALIAAAAHPQPITAVVSRGGRPDLAGNALPHVQAPTLLIVGSADTQVVSLNRAAFSQLRCEKQLELVPGATHLFEEQGALEQVAQLACGWFQRYLSVT